jgi:hypothetical protein
MADDVDHSPMTVDVGSLGPAAIASTYRDAVEYEAACRGLHAASDAGERRRLLMVVAAALMRLMRDPYWVPTSARLDGSRLEVRIVVELDPDAEREAAERTISGLHEVLAELEAGPGPEVGA